MSLAWLKGLCHFEMGEYDVSGIDNCGVRTKDEVVHASLERGHKFHLSSQAVMTRVDEILFRYRDAQAK